MSQLTIKNLSIQVESKLVCSKLNMLIKPSEIHALMGPNGSGKSSLAYTILGHPDYKVSHGDILFGNRSIVKLSPDKRAKLGLFLSFQEPPEIGGIETGLFLKQLIQKIEPERQRRFDKLQLLKKTARKLHTKDDFLMRLFNKGFSGGEKKKSEILQLLALQPKIAILDEIDSGVDIDALKIIAELLMQLVKKEKTGLLLISHYTKMFHIIRPDMVHIMIDGNIVKTGGKEVLLEIEKKGFRAMV